MCSSTLSYKDLKMADYRITPGLHMTSAFLRRTAFAKFKRDAKVFWDVGAGCGQLGIRWMQEHPGSVAVAIENNPQYYEDCLFNREAQGTPSLIVTDRDATGDLSDLPRPDAVYMGCLGWNDENLAWHVVHNYLQPGGTICAFGLQDRAVKHINDMVELGIGTVRVVNPEPHLAGMKFWFYTKPDSAE